MHVFSRSFALVAAMAISATPLLANASSHRDSPVIAEDPVVDGIDLYAFISPTNSDRLVLIANYQPFLMPTSGPNFYRFSDSALYEITIDNDGDAVPDIAYRWAFETEVSNPNTTFYNTGPITSIDDPDLNVRQVYDLFRVDEHTGHVTQLVNNGPVAPWNVGSFTFPNDSYESVAVEAIVNTGDISVFVGPRDDSFFADLGVFDLVGISGSPTLAGFNTMSLVLEVPITDVVAGGVRPPAGSRGPTSLIGVNTRAKRPRVRVLSPTGIDTYEKGFVQVSRVATPLLNVVLIPLGAVDLFNRSNPADDLAQFGEFLLQPELPGLLNAVLGVGCQATPPQGRTDIIALLGPRGTQPADLLRLDITEGQTFTQGGFPNGRRLEDDVVDTLLTAVCNNMQSLGDGVDSNDLPFLPAFPFLASPHSGNP